MDHAAGNSPIPAAAAGQFEIRHGYCSPALVGWHHLLCCQLLSVASNNEYNSAVRRAVVAVRLSHQIRGGITFSPKSERCNKRHFL